MLSQTRNAACIAALSSSWPCPVVAAAGEAAVQELKSQISFLLSSRLPKKSLPFLLVRFLFRLLT